MGQSMVVILLIAFGCIRQGSSQSSGFTPGPGATINSNYFPVASSGSSGSNGYYCDITGQCYQIYTGFYNAGSNNGYNCQGSYCNNYGSSSNSNLVCTNGACFDTTNTKMSGTLPGNNYNGGSGATYCYNGNCYNSGSGVYSYNCNNGFCYSQG